MEKKELQAILKGNTYPGRGIVIGRSEDGRYAVTAYFIMGRSVNSRNRVFVEQDEGIRTEAFDESKLSDPSLIIYAPVRVLGRDDDSHERRSGRIRYMSSWGRERRSRKL